MKSSLTFSYHFDTHPKMGQSTGTSLRLYHSKQLCKFDTALHSIEWFSMNPWSVQLLIQRIPMANGNKTKLSLSSIESFNLQLCYDVRN